MARLCRAVLIAAVATLIVAPGASATVIVAVDGSALAFGSNDTTGANDATVGFSSDSKVTITSIQGVEMDPSADAACDFVSQYQIACAPNGFTDLQGYFTSSNDNVGLQVCGLRAVIDLGDGTNAYQGPECTDGTSARVDGGSGQDTLSGGSGGTTVEELNGNGAGDSLYGGGGDDVLHGGDGNDTVSGGDGNDQLFGENNDDVIRGSGGNDLEDGGPGNDQIGYSPGVSNDDDQGADVLTGGPGDDKLLLDAHTGGVNISIDGQANDGSPGEGDNVGADLETIDGTTAADTFVGSPGPDQFNGNAGNDTIRGAGGDDRLYGGGGDDDLNGDAGNDKVEGANGADRVDGGPGTDQIYGDIGSCSFSCSFDADTLYSRDGERDAVDCGGGADSAIVDTLDVVAFCASVDRQGGPASGPGPAPGAGGGGGNPFALKVAGSVKAKALLAHGLVVRLTCASACKIVATLKAKAKTVGSGRKTLLKAGQAKLVVKVPKQSRAALRRFKGKLALRIKVTDAAGKTTTITRTVKLKR
jgi:Ca2+-binding RTX toxin-like protein